MNEAVKRLAGVQEGAVNMVTIVYIVIHRFFETVNRVGGGVPSLEAKLERWRVQAVWKCPFEYMFKQFSQHRRDCDAAIVGDITFISLSILDDGNDISISKLFWNEWVREHAVYELGQPRQKVVRRIFALYPNWKVMEEGLVRLWALTDYLLRASLLVFHKTEFE